MPMTGVRYNSLPLNVHVRHSYHYHWQPVNVSTPGLRWALLKTIADVSVTINQTYFTVIVAESKLAVRCILGPL